MHPTCRNMRTDSNIFSLQHLCVFLGGKSIRSIKIHQLHPISYPCNDPSSYHPKELRNYENASNLPETLSRLSCRSNWSNAVHTCPHTSVDHANHQCIISMLSIHSLNVQIDWHQRADQECSVRSQLHFCSSLSGKKYIYTMFHWHPTSSYICQKHIWKYKYYEW